MYNPSQNRVRYPRFYIHNVHIQQCGAASIESEAVTRDSCSLRCEQSLLAVSSNQHSVAHYQSYIHRFMLTLACGQTFSCHIILSLLH